MNSELSTQPKLAQTCPNLPKYQNLFHEDSPPQDFIEITLVSSLSLTLKSNDCQNQSSKNYVLKKVWTKPTAAAQTIENFLCELGMKPHLVEISILSRA